MMVLSIFSFSPNGIITKHFAIIFSSRSHDPPVILSQPIPGDDRLGIGQLSGLGLRQELVDRPLDRSDVLVLRGEAAAASGPFGAGNDGAEQENPFARPARR